MPAGYTHLTIEQGATFSQQLELTDSTNTPIDLTDYVGTCKIRKSYYSDIDVYPLTVTIPSPESDGKIILSSTSSNTTLMTPGRYVFDVEITSGSTITRILEGIAEVRPNATR
jgi:hypothetical protein